MDNEFPFVAVSAKLRRIVGEPEEGSRIFRTEGDEDALNRWSGAIFSEFDGGLVSPGGVPMFAPVSRAGVHKRIKEGRLTAFVFTITKLRKPLFGKSRSERVGDYIYIPVSECIAWADDLASRQANKSESLETWRARRKEKRGTAADLDAGFFRGKSKSKKK